MNRTKKAILFGDYIHYQWHPLLGVDKQIEEILKETIELTITEDKKRLSVEDLNNYDLCISYVEFDDTPLSDEQVNAMISYVSSGGGLLVIHNGISLQKRSEISLLLGAKFTGHPDYDTLPTLTYNVKAVDHPIMDGITDFSLRDEPYQFLMDHLADKTVLFDYRYEDHSWPAAWALKFGMGRVVYLAPGHNEETFKNEGFRQIIRNSSKWCTRNLGYKNET